MGQSGVRAPHGSRARLAGACSREARPAHACEPSGGGNRRGVAIEVEVAGTRTGAWKNQGTTNAVIQIMWIEICL